MARRRAKSEMAPMLYALCYFGFYLVIGMLLMEGLDLMGILYNSYDLDNKIFGLVLFSSGLLILAYSLVECSE